MISKPISIALFATLAFIFIALRVFANFDGLAGLLFNVATALLIVYVASQIWRRSEFHPSNRR